MTDLASLSGLDGSFLAFERPNTPLHLGAVILLDPAPEGLPGTSIDPVRALVERCVTEVPMLRRRILAIPFGLAHPLSAPDPEFDMDDHLRRMTLPAPGDEPALWDLMADLMSRPLDRRRPLWETTVVDGLADGRTAVISKLHHALLDGTAGTALLAAFFSPSSTDSVGENQDRTPGEPLPSLVTLLRYAAAALVEGSVAGWGSLEALVAAVWDVAERRRQLGEGVSTLAPALGQAPMTSLNGTPSSHRRFVGASAPLAEFRTVARRFEVTVNDVILAVVSSVLRRILAERGESPQKPLVALVPVSVREGTQPSAQVVLGNELAGMLVSLATTEHEPGRRLLSIARSTREAKTQLRVAGSQILVNSAAIVPPGVLSLAARLADTAQLFEHVPPLFNLSVSSVIGPDVSLSCAGARVAAIYPAGPVAGGSGLNVSTLTYLGTVHFGLLACARLVPELAATPGMILDAVAELLAATP